MNILQNWNSIVEIYWNKSESVHARTWLPYIPYECLLLSYPDDIVAGKILSYLLSITVNFNSDLINLSCIGVSKLSVTRLNIVLRRIWNYVVVVVLFTSGFLRIFRYTWTNTHGYINNKKIRSQSKNLLWKKINTSVPRQISRYFV